MLHKDSVFFEGANHNISAYKFLGIKNQNFTFDLKKKQWINANTGRALDIEKKNFKEGANIVTIEKSDKYNSQQWDLIEC
jgi:hypothetical protein